jgi:hypothetical protein
MWSGGDTDGVHVFAKISERAFDCQGIEQRFA